MNLRNSLMKSISLSFKREERGVSMVVNNGIINIIFRLRNFQNELITYFVQIRLVRKRRHRMIKTWILFILVRVS